MPRGAAPRAVLLAALLAGLRGATGRLLSGQPVCRLGTQKPCYEVIYFRDASQRLNFEEARAACRRNGSQLVSIESEDEQRLIVKFIKNLLASDGDFWIGLRRREDQQSNGTACQDLYAWIDGSTAAFRNWYVDEPSCGSEVCVVMYHQPSAPAGIGGPYMFQWNDDRCTMKNNFICKYSDGFKERREGMVLAEPREILESRKRSHPTGAVTRQHVKSNQEPKDKGAPGHIPRGQPPRTQRRTKNRLSRGMWARGRRRTRCLPVDHHLLLRISSRPSAHHGSIGLITPLPLCSPSSHHLFSLPKLVPFCVL